MSMSPQSPNKRKLSQTSEALSETEKSPIPSKIQKSTTETNNNAPPMVALPPPLMQYPNGQLVSVVHHPQQPYYPMYHPYYPVSPQQHPFAAAHPSPVLIPQPHTNESASQQQQRKSNTPRILPKNPDSPLSSPAGALYPQPPPSPFYHPYALQMSPTMMPNYPPPPPINRHNSISSSPGLGPSAMNSTADQREKARKVSHSAIERRRRERINDKILQLKQLIPSCAEQDNLHKMSILQSAIDYIAYLKDIVKSLDENGTESTTEQLLKGDHLRVKMAKSMLPKEVEPFTTQFSVHTTIPEEKKSAEQQTIEKRGLKPMDVIKSGTSIVSNTTATPLTPPQEPMSTTTTTTKKKATSLSNSPVLLSSLPPSTSHPTSLPSTPILKPDETKHMSLQNILC